MDEEILNEIQGQQVENDVPQFATLADVERLVSSIPRGPQGDDAQITAELVQEILDVATPIKGVDYRDGIDGTNGIDGKDAPVLSAEDIAGMLEALPEVKKLSFSAIKGLNKLDDQVAVLEAARKRNSADHEFYDEKINEILEWIDRIKGLKLIQAGSNRISATNINWSTVNWGDFFTDFYLNIDWTAFFSNVDWTQNNWADFFTAVDWSQFTDWDSFVTSLITNWSATNWDNFIDNFITNVDNDDVFNFLNQMSGLNKGDMLVYNSVTATWEILPAGTDGFVITANSAVDQGVEYQAPSGGSPLAVQEEGSTVDANTVTLNFTGAGATATQTSPGVVQVDIPGGGGSANAVVETVTQTAHGFAVGDWVRVGGAGTYTKAQANSSTNAEVIGVVTNVVGVNEFELTTEGVVTGAWVPSYGFNQSVFLSTSVAGGTQAVSTSTIGSIDKPLGVIIEDAVSMKVSTYRGRQITNATSGATTSAAFQRLDLGADSSGAAPGIARFHNDSLNQYGGMVYAEFAGSGSTIYAFRLDSSGMYFLEQQTTSGPTAFPAGWVGDEYFYFDSTGPAMESLNVLTGGVTVYTGFPTGLVSYWTDGVDIYRQTGTATIYDRYVISGTTLTLSGTFTFSVAPVSQSIWLKDNTIVSYDGATMQSFDLSGTLISSVPYTTDINIGANHSVFVGVGGTGVASSMQIMQLNRTSVGGSDAITSLDIRTITNPVQ